MSFIEFTAKKTRNLDKPTVSINKGGRIVFSQRCYTDYLKGFKFAQLFFDPDKGIVGIKPTNEELPNVYPLKVGRDQKNAYISFRRSMSNYHAAAAVLLHQGNEKTAAEFIESCMTVGMKSMSTVPTNLQDEAKKAWEMEKTSLSILISQFGQERRSQLFSQLNQLQ